MTTPRLPPPLRRELPWLLAEAAILLVLLRSNAPELWFWFVVLVVLLAYRIERFLSGGEG
jgi:hypothetical protein